MPSAKKATVTKPATKKVAVKTVAKKPAVKKPAPKPGNYADPLEPRGQPWERDKTYLARRFDDPADRKLLKIHKVSKPEDADFDQGMSFHGLPYPLRFDDQNIAEVPKGDWDVYVEPQRVWYGLEPVK
jgi:hypothetical protein